MIKKKRNRKEYFCLQYEWKNEDDILEKEQLFSEITVEDIPHWTDELKKGLTIQVTDCEELSPMEQEYNLMKKHHTYSRVLAPIFSRDHLSGFIGMDHFYKRNLRTVYSFSLRRRCSSEYSQGKISACLRFWEKILKAWKKNVRS